MFFFSKKPPCPPKVRANICQLHVTFQNGAAQVLLTVGRSFDPPQLWRSLHLFQSAFTSRFLFDPPSSLVR